MLVSKFLSAFMDILPIMAVIVFFQIFVIQQPFPNIENTLWGLFLVVVGLFIFVIGLETALFPLGEKMANQFARKGNVWLIMLFGFALGFSTTIAEPALAVIAKKAAVVAAESGAIANDLLAIASYQNGLRLSIALAVGFSISLGVLRIIKGWPLIWFIWAGYGSIVLLTFFAPREIIGIAYDSGGITTSTITVPLVTALGVGLASSLRGRNPLLDGFGLIAFASLTPILFVMMYGIILHGVQ